MKGKHTMHNIIQWIELGIVTCIFIMCACGVTGIIYIMKLIARWEKEENGSSHCPDKIEPEVKNYVR